MLIKIKNKILKIRRKVVTILVIMLFLILIFLQYMSNLPKAEFIRSGQPVKQITLTDVNFQKTEKTDNDGYYFKYVIVGTSHNKTQTIYTDEKPVLNKGKLTIYVSKDNKFSYPTISDFTEKKSTISNLIEKQSNPFKEIIIVMFLVFIMLFAIPAIIG